MDEHCQSPVRLDYYRLVKRLSDHLTNLGDAHIPEIAFEAWAGHFESMVITQEEVDYIGSWYNKHYTIGLCIPSLRQFLQHFRTYSDLPDHRLPDKTELDAVSILESCMALGLDRSSLENALFLAAALMHHSTYRTDDLPHIDREAIREEFERRARFGAYFSTDILNDAEKGVGEAARLQRILFPRNLV